MIDLTRYEISQIATELYDREYNFSIDDVEEVYNILKSETRYKNKSKSAMQDLVTDIALGLAGGESKEEIISNKGSQKHLNYFDNFYEQGMTKEVIDAIKSAGGTLDVLKGIKPYKSDTITSPVDNRFRFSYEWEVGTAGESFIPISFDIYFEGKNIYHWGNSRRMRDNEPTFYDRVEMAYIIRVQEKSYKPQQTLYKETIETQDGSYYLEGYKTSKGNNFTRKRYAKGTIIDGVAVGGRWINGNDA